MTNDTARTDGPTEGADDQRAAEVLRRYLEDPNRCDHPTDEELEALLTGRDRLRDRRDYLQGQLDIIYDAEYSRNDALKRRIEKMTAAGDNLAGELDRPTGTDPEVRALIDRWRSVRGDAPTQPPADAEARVVIHDAGVTRYHADGSREVLCEVPAAPAVARTDGQPPADEPHEGLTCAEHDVIDRAQAKVIREIGDLVDPDGKFLTVDLPGAVREALGRHAAPADEPRSSRWLVKDGPDSILGSFATRSAAEEAQERVSPAYPTAWVEEYPARSAAPADDTADLDELADVVRTLTRFWRKNPNTRADIAARSKNLRDLLDRLVDLPRSLTERALIEHVRSAPAVSPAEPPADELRDAVNRLDLLRRRWEPLPDAHAVSTVLRALARAQHDLAQRAAAPADDTAAPAVRVWQSDDGDWGWACARCDYRSVAWWSDRAVAERAAVEHGRDRCRAAGGSAPASTDGDQR